MNKGGVMADDIFATDDNGTEEAKEWEKFYVKLYLNSLKKRTMLINQDIDDDLIEKHTLQLINLDKINHDPITIYVNSNGGNLYEGINLCDVISSLKSPVNTICLSHAFSAAFVIFMAGKERMAYKNSILLMHPIIRTNIADENVPSLLSEAEFLDKITKRLAKYFAEKTSRSEKHWEQKVLKSAHDVYFFPEEALKLGIITEIITGERND